MNKKPGEKNFKPTKRWCTGNANYTRGKNKTIHTLAQLLNVLPKQSMSSLPKDLERRTQGIFCPCEQRTNLECLKQLSGEDKGGILLHRKTVLEILKDKNPTLRPINFEHVKGPLPIPFHPSIFDRVSRTLFKKAVSRTSSSHGPSGSDADEWRR